MPNRYICLEGEGRRKGEIKGRGHEKRGEGVDWCNEIGADTRTTSQCPTSKFYLEGEMENAGWEGKRDGWCKK